MAEALPPKKKTTRAAARDRADRAPGGLTAPQITRFRKLLETDIYDAWAYHREKRTDRAEVDDAHAEAAMMLWLARHGHEACLGKMYATPLYTAEENLELLAAGRSTADENKERLRNVLEYVRWYGDLMVTHGEALRAIVSTHRRAGDWSRGRILGFRLIEWLVDDAAALDRDEIVEVTEALAGAHLIDPAHGFENVDARLSRRNGGEPWRPRALALALGSMSIWTDALMRVEDVRSEYSHHLFSSSGRFSLLVDVFDDLPLSDVERFLVDFDAQALPDDLLALEAFLRRRKLSVADLVRIARAIVARRAHSPRLVQSRLVDVLCLLAIEAEADAPIDDLLTFAIVDDAWTPRYLALLERVGDVRRRALIEADLADPARSGGGILGAIVDADLLPIVERYRARGTVPFTFARAVAQVPGGEAMAGFEVRPPWVSATYVGAALRDVESCLARMQDPRVLAANCFTRESMMALLRWSPHHPAVTRILQHLGQATHYRALLQAHETPDLLLARLSELALPEATVRELFTALDHDKFDLASARLSPTWTAWLSAWRATQAAPVIDPFTQSLDDVRRIAAGIPGARTTIHALQIDSSERASPGEHYIGGSFLGGELDESVKLLITIGCAEVPELAARYPDVAYLSVVVPGEVTDDHEAFEEAKLVRIAKADVKRPEKPLFGLRVRLHRLEIPGDVFVTALRQDDGGESVSGPLTDLYEALWSLPGYLLGDALLGGDLNNRHREEESEGPSDRFVLSVKSHFGADGALFVYEDVTLFER
jgi:hypothetical protein